MGDPASHDPPSPRLGRTGATAGKEPEEGK